MAATCMSEPSFSQTVAELAPVPAPSTCAMRCGTSAIAAACSRSRTSPRFLRVASSGEVIGPASPLVQKTNVVRTSPACSASVPPI